MNAAIRSLITRAQSRRAAATRLCVSTLLLVVGCMDALPTNARGVAEGVGTPPVTAVRRSITTVTGFTFLSPTVRTPTAPVGTFDPARAPTVRIVCVSAAAPNCPTVATLSMGTGANDIKLDVALQEYRVNWTSPSTLETGGGRYRIDVLDGTTVLGSADAWVTITTRDAALASDAQIAIIRGKPVSIRFRITTQSFTDALNGAPDAPAVQAFADARAPLQPSDFDQNHPDLRPLRVSFNTVLLRLKADATVGATNALLRSVNATLIGGSRGIANRVPGLLVLRFNTTTHAQLAAILDVLKASPLVLGAVPEALLSDAALPTRGASVPLNWNWDLRPAVGGTWGLKTARVPQMWNLNKAVQQQGTLVRTGVWEVFDVARHTDLPIPQRLGSDPVQTGAHATQVAGIIGALHGNGGIDGVTPFANLVTMRINSTSDQVAQIRDWSAANIRVVNASFTYDWFGVGQSTLATIATSSIASLFMDVMGGIMRDGFERLSVEGATLPIVVVAAGNESSPNAPFPTRLAGPLQNAGVAQGVASIIVVEALARAFGTGPLETRVERTSFTAVGGHVAAAGEEVMSTTTNDAFAESINGTSFSAPLVAGVVSYLLATYPTIPAPTMTRNVVRDLLIAQGVPVPNSNAPSVDAFATLLSADALMGSDFVLRSLLDVDDGTADGNTRVDLTTGTELISTVVGGDRVINMADFRRWRDWRLQSEIFTGTSINGRPDHPARDLNGDGVFTPDQTVENIYPRGDFNGDGRISSTATRTMPAATGGGAQTDLDVFRRLFNDPLYAAAELPELLVSGDIDFRTTRCMAINGAFVAHTTIKRPGESAVYKFRELRAGTTQQMYTVPAVSGAYLARIDVFDAAGNLLGFNEQDVVVGLGSDALVDMPCYRLQVTIDAPTSVSGGQATGFGVTAMLIDVATGLAVPAGGANVSMTSTNASPGSAFGVTNSSGSYGVQVTPSTNATSMTIRFTVRTTSGLTATVEATRSYGGVVLVSPSSLSLQVLGGAVAGRFPSPVRFRARASSIPGTTIEPGSTIEWTTSARGNGSGFSGFGPVNLLNFVFVGDPATTGGTNTLDFFGTATFTMPPIGSGITLTVRACLLKNGVQQLQTSGLPYCVMLDLFY